MQLKILIPMTWSCLLLLKQLSSTGHQSKHPTEGSAEKERTCPAPCAVRGQAPQPGAAVNAAPGMGEAWAHQRDDSEG